MTELEHAQIIGFFLGVGMLWFAYSYAYRRTRVRNFQEDLFTIRDELFDYMWKNELLYDLPAYRLMRDNLNGTIRFAGELNIFTVFVLAFLTRNPPKEGILRRVIKKIEDPVTRVHFEKVYKQMALRLRQFILLEGPIRVFSKPTEIALRYLSSSDFRNRAEERLQFQPIADELTVLGKEKSSKALLMKQALHTSFPR